MVRVARLHDHDSPLRVEDVGLAAPARGEVRVELAFAGVNPVDSYVARGLVAADGPTGAEGAAIGGHAVLMSGTAGSLR